MQTKPVLIALAVLAAAVLLVQAPSPSSADSPERVVVTNFPEVQEIVGSVSVPEPVPQSALVRRLDVVVPPTDRSATSQLVEVGTLDAAGFTHAVVSLRGEVQGNLLRDGAAGLVLVPDEEPVLRALLEEGRFDFPLEVEAQVLRAGRGFFASAQLRHVLGFPRYRLFLYNSVDRSVEVDVYVYPTS